MRDDEDEKEHRISGKIATRLAEEAARNYPPVKIESPGDAAGSAEDAAAAPTAQPPAPVNAARSENRRNPPPRVRKPSPIHHQYVAPTSDIEGYQARVREAFGNTMSDEFVEVMMGKLVEALKPNPYDQLKEETFNAALAILHSANCQPEFQALIVVEIIATGFSGLRFLPQSMTLMTEDYINVYGTYAHKLVRLQIELMQTLERLQRGGKQSVEIGRVDIHAGAQVLAIAKGAGEGRAWPQGSDRRREATGEGQNTKRPHASGGCAAPAGEFGQSPALRRKNPRRHPLPASGGPGAGAVPHAWGRQGLRRAGRPPQRQFQARALDARRYR